MTSDAHDVLVHHRGARGVDGILRLIELAGHDGPLEMMLSAMCVELAAIAGADIASIYVRTDDQLAMRGNHGFGPGALGTTLGVGEGITGLVAECMRPVSASRAEGEPSYKHVPGLGEEHFPVFAGIPLIGNLGGGPAVIGVLVLQRRSGPFGLDEVTLATALGAPVTLAIERRLNAAIRSARLNGTPHVDGLVLGRAAVVPTTTALGAVTIDPERAIARLREDLGRALKRLSDATAPAVGAALDRCALALCDARLRERLVTAARQPDGLRSVARQYARVPHRLGTVSEHAAHVAELEDLCALLAEPSALRPGAIWIADRIHAPLAIIAVARGAGALVASDVIAPAAIAIARAAALPAISDVPGLFGWARPGDLLAIDGGTGVVLVHPPAADVEALRHARPR